MKKSILSFLLLFTIKISAQENKVYTSSDVKKVTVFLTGAELNHEAKIKLKKGKNIVTFTGLSPRLDERSINLTPGSAEINVLYINTHTNYLEEKKDNDKIQSLKDSVDFYKDKLELLKFEQDELETEKTLLFKNQSIGGQAGVSIADVEKSADFYRKRSTEINQLMFKNNKLKVKLEKYRKQYRKQLIELDAEVNPPTSDITATFIANKDVETTVSFKYLIPTAGWTPKYDIRTEGTGKEVTLVNRAILFNNSGLDWKDIKIILSTANPDIGINIPQLSKWYLGNEQVAEEKNLAQYIQVLPGVVNTESDKLALKEVQIVEEGDDLANKRFADNKAKQKQNQIQFKKIEVDMLSTEYSIEQPYTVYSDSKPYTIDVLEKTVTAFYEYKAVPALDKDVFLQTKLALKDLPDLVSGDASVYFGGSYIGKTEIKTIDLDDTLTISLGRDKKIQMVRKESKQDYQRSFVGNYEKEVLKYETTIKNTRDIPISIIIEDQIPVASNSDEEININETSGANFDKPSGKLTWKIILNPNESKIIKMGYTSKYPKSIKTKKKKFRSVSAPSF